MEGGCHCKAIRFKINQETSWVGACYCIDCRKVSGAPYVVWAMYNTDKVEIIQGTPKVYSSSHNVNRSFCEKCGSPFSYQYKDRLDKIGIAVGVFDNAENFKLQKHSWTSQKLPWIHITDELPQETGV